MELTKPGTLKTDSEVPRYEAGVNFAADPCLSSHRCSGTTTFSPTQRYLPRTQFAAGL